MANQLCAGMEYFSFSLSSSLERVSRVAGSAVAVAICSLSCVPIFVSGSIPAPSVYGPTPLFSNHAIFTTLQLQPASIVCWNDRDFAP